MSNIFGSGNISAKRYGELLADVVMNAVNNELSKKGVSEVKERFGKEGWTFENDRYSLSILYLYISQAEYHVQTNHLDSIDKLDDVYGSFLDSILKSVPEKYEDDILSIEGRTPSNIKLEMSDEPNLTISRLAAEKYFGSDPNLKRVMVFGQRAKSFSNMLDTFEDEVDF